MEAGAWFRCESGLTLRVIKWSCCGRFSERTGRAVVWAGEVREITGEGASGGTAFPIGSGRLWIAALKSFHGDNVQLT